MIHALNQLVLGGAAIVEALGLTPGKFNRLAAGAFYLVYAKIVLTENVTANTVIPSEDLDTNPDCVTTKHICPDSSCKGMNGVCKVGNQSGCMSGSCFHVALTQS